MVKKVVQIGADWCKPCKDLAPIVKDLCTKMGYTYEYLDLEGKDGEGMKIVEENFFRSIPVLQYINTESLENDGEPVIRYKVSGFDVKGVTAFLLDHNSDNEVEDFDMDGGEDE